MILAVDTTEARVAAVLHDVVEDTTVTLEQQRAEGFRDAVIDAVETLTASRCVIGPEEGGHLR